MCASWRARLWCAMWHQGAGPPEKQRWCNGERLWRGSVSDGRLLILKTSIVDRQNERTLADLWSAGQPRAAVPTCTVAAP